MFTSAATSSASVRRARGLALAQHAGALRVIEREQHRLLEGTGGALVHGVLGVALHLDGATLPGGDEQAGGVPPKRHAGRVVQRVARRQLGGRLGVGQHPLVGGAGGAGGGAGQRQRGAQQLHELAARDAGGRQVRALGELGAHVLEVLGLAELLLEAAPVGLAVAALGGDALGGGVVERLTHDHVLVVVVVAVGGLRPGPRRPAARRR